MKTAISLPDELFEQVEEAAKRTGKSRSQVFREALVEYLRKRDPESVTRAMDDALVEVGGEEDGWRREAVRRTFERTEW